jgi:peptidylprolyl isomerase
LVHALVLLFNKAEKVSRKLSGSDTTMLMNAHKLAQKKYFKTNLISFAAVGTKTNVMGQVKEGDVVRVHYTGTLTSGEQFDSSAGREPLEFTVGAGQMIKGFDAAMPGMTVGEKKTINIAPEEAYGPKNEEAIIEFPKEHVPADMKLEPGMQLTLSDQAGNPVPVIVVEVKDEVVILDANHFLAGEALVFDIELVEIV